MSGIEPSKLAGPSPYQGPRPFRTDEALFGRDQETTELHYRVLAERIVVLYSPSGAGKSSLIQAGLVPRMRDSGFDAWRPTRVNTAPPPGLEGFGNRYSLSARMGFEEGVPEELRRRPEVFAGQRLVEYVRARPRRPGAPENLFLVIDQFEEVLTVDPLAADLKAAFFEELGELLRVPNVWAVLALREDYLAGLDPYADRIPTHLRNRFRLDRLTVEEAAKAIEGPALKEKLPRQFAPGAALDLAKRLAKVTVQNPDGSFKEDEDGQYVEPMQLQVVCHEMWTQMPGDDLEVDAGDVAKFGDVTNALAGYYDHRLEQDIANKDIQLERRIRKWVGRQLITAAGIRSQVLRGQGKTEELDNDLIDKLVACHLVRPEQRAYKIWYELSHDRLIRPIRQSNEEWFEKYEVKAQKAAALWWLQDRKNDALLLSGDELREARQWVAENPGAVEPAIIEFMERSEEREAELAAAARAAARELARARRARIWSVIFGLIAVVAVGAMWWAVELKKEAVALALTSQDNLAKMLQERARVAILSAVNTSSPEDRQRAWVSGLAAMHLSSTPMPEAAGRLFEPSIYPGYKAGKEKAAGKAETRLAIALRGSPKLTIMAQVVPNNHEVFAFECAPKDDKDCPSTLSGRPTSLAVDAGSGAVLVGYGKGVIQARGKTIQTLNPAEDVTALAVTRNWLAAGTSKGAVEVFAGLDPESAGAKVPICTGDKCPAVGALAWEGENPTVLAVGTTDGRIQLMERNAGGWRKRSELTAGEEDVLGAVTALAYWPKTSLLVSGHRTGQIHIWNIQSGLRLASAQMHEIAVAAIVFAGSPEVLRTVSIEGVERETTLAPRVFDRDWRLAELLAESGGRARKELYDLTRQRLGYDMAASEPRPGPQTSELALAHFSSGVMPVFTEAQLRNNQILLRRKLASSIVFPAFIENEGEILVLPDFTGNTTTAVAFTEPVKEAFKVEFDYRIWKRQDVGDTWMAGDWLKLLFYRKLDTANLGQFFQGVEPAGYELEFSFYRPRGEGFFFYDRNKLPGDRPVVSEITSIQTRDQWRRTCVEVSPEKRESLCQPNGEAFQGVGVYFEGKKVFSHAGAIAPREGGLGFSAFSGEAQGERSIRNVVVTRAGEKGVRFGPGNVRFWSSVDPADTRFPSIAGGMISLLQPEQKSLANAVVFTGTDTSNRVPDDFAVEFEYADGSAGPGSGFSYFFGADPARYKDSVLPPDVGHAVVPGNGYRLMFTRQIALVAGERQFLARRGAELFSYGTWKKVRVEARKSQGRVRVVHEGVEVMDAQVPLDFKNRAMGFGASTGDRSTGEIKIRNVLLWDLTGK